MIRNKYIRHIHYNFPQKVLGLSLLICLVSVLSITSYAQTLLVHEDFENGAGIFVASGDDPWDPDTSLSYQGNASLHNAYQNSSVNTLTLDTVLDLSGYSAALLEFHHIGKIEIADVALVQVSTTGGSNWTSLTANEYLGSGFLLNDNQFFDGSYTVWDFNNYTAPDNNWWKKETFNLTGFLGSEVKVRFKITADGTLNFHGWWLDEIRITGLTSGELDPPEIQHTPIANTGSTGAISIQAVITDASGIDSALIYYRVNSGIWNGPKVMTDNSGDTYSYAIPGQSIGSYVDYYIRAVDASNQANEAFHPSGQSNSYHTYYVIEAISSYPYLETFETSSADQWTHKADLTVGNTGVVPNDDWEKGDPTTFFIDEPHNGNNAYCTRLDFGYFPNSRSSLLSPVFDLSSLTEGTLTFHHQYITEMGDGGRIDYITGDFSTVINNLDWKVLGAVGDIRAKNWYNEPTVASSSAITPRAGWSGNSAQHSGSQNAWLFSTYDITDLIGEGTFIRFRFVFTSLAFSFSNEGWLVDDIALDNTVHSPSPEQNEGWILGEIYPNPAQTHVYLPISLNKPANIRVEFFNNLGQQVHQADALELSSGKHYPRLDTEALVPGVYQVRISIDETVHTRKLSVVR